MNNFWFRGSLVIGLPIIVIMTLSYLFRKTEIVHHLDPYGAAISGGLIAGLFTYAAIYITLQAQRNERVLQAFPKKLKRVDELLELIDKTLNDPRTQYFIDSDKGPEAVNVGTSIYRNFYIQCIEESIEIDFNVYQYSRDLKYRIEELIDTYTTLDAERLIFDDSRLMMPNIEESVRYRKKFIEDVIAEVLNYKKKISSYRKRIMSEFQALE